MNDDEDAAFENDGASTSRLMNSSCEYSSWMWLSRLTHMSLLLKAMLSSCVSSLTIVTLVHVGSCCSWAANEAAWWGDEYLSVTSSALSISLSSSVEYSAYFCCCCNWNLAPLHNCDRIYETNLKPFSDVLAAAAAAASFKSLTFFS